MFKKILCLFTLFHASLAVDNNNTKLEDAIKTDAIHQKITAIDEAIKDNLWFKRYGNYLSYQKLIEELSTVDAEIKKFKKYQKTKSPSKNTKNWSQNKNL